METDNNIYESGNGVFHVNEKAIHKTFSEYGNEMNDIISNKPPFVVRWGTFFFFILLLLIGLLAWFIKHPDKVASRGILNSINAPKEVIAQSGGKLVKLFVQESQMVNDNGILGYIESTASHEEIISLSKLLDSISINIGSSETNTLNFLSTSFTNLGELQTAFQAFTQAGITYADYLQNGYFIKKRRMLENDLHYLLQMRSTLLLQKSLFQQDLRLTDTTFKANEKLKDDKIISPLEYRVEQSKRIAKEMTLPQINASIISNESQQNEKKKEIAELENRIEQQRNIFIQALNTIKSQLAEWKRKYLLVAPIEGKISFSSFIQENQQLKQGQVVCFINPGNTDFYVETLIPQFNFGKIKAGQEVLLKFPAYPYQEFGSVKGIIEYINATPSDSGYLAKVSLPDGLITNHNKQLRYNAGLSVHADIIVEKLNLLQRLYYNIRKNL